MTLPLHRWIESYLNLPEVRKSLGVDTSIDHFSLSKRTMSEAFWEAGDGWHQTQLYIAELLERGVRVLIYAGTHDFIANWIGNERWTLNMEWSGKSNFAELPSEEWEIDGKAAGKSRTFGDFTFVTIYGAGHFVGGVSTIYVLVAESIIDRCHMTSLSRHSRWSDGG